MRPRLFTSAALFALCAASAAAQQPAPGSLAADLLRDVAETEEKLVGLARAMPADKWDWRPGEGVRSVGEVFLHIAADNYVLPAMFGTPAPAETKITAEYQTAVTYERQKLSRDATIAELEKSFAFLKQTLSGMTQPKFAEKLPQFGPEATHQSGWVLAVTHLHEHLGQAIAYARMNGIVPPWSRQG